MAGIVFVKNAETRKINKKGDDLICPQLLEHSIVKSVIKQ